MKSDCVICHNAIEGFGHNAQPLSSGRCCDSCNRLVLLRFYGADKIRDIGANLRRNPDLIEYGDEEE